MRMQLLKLPLGALLTNSYVVADDHGRAAVIDPGFDPDAIDVAVRQRNWQVVAIVATHGHFDHVAGNQRAIELWSAPLWMHPLAIPIATTAAEHAAWFGFTCDNSPPPDHTFEHGDTLNIGELAFQVRHTPGHSPGGVSLVGHDIALVGDTLFAGSVGRYDLPHSDYDALMTAIRDHLMTLPDDTVVYPGHGDETTIGRERMGNPFRYEWSNPT